PLERPDGRREATGFRGSAGTRHSTAGQSLLPRTWIPGRRAIAGAGSQVHGAGLLQRHFRERSDPRFVRSRTARARGRFGRGFRRYSGRSLSQPQTDHDPAALGRDGGHGRADSAEENPGKQGLSPARGDRPGVDDPRIDFAARKTGAQAVTANGSVFRTGNATAMFVRARLQLMTAALPTPHLPQEFASRFQSAGMGAGF